MSRKLTPRERLILALSPPAEISKRDTSLRFTDILFGFVIREIFLRVQHWNDLKAVVQWQLAVSSALVLGSWIGYRRSLHRSDYEPKFVNLPLIRFVLDQLMIVLYFRTSTLAGSPDTFANDPVPATLVADTMLALVLIFVLYLAWDVSGLAMTTTRDWLSETRTRKYLKIDSDTGKQFDPPKNQDPNIAGTVITTLALGMVIVLWRVAAESDGLTRNASINELAAAMFLLVGYRIAKDVRTSWNLAS